MTSADVLNLAGLGFQLLGIAISARGLYHSWRDYAPPGERFLDPLHRVIGAARGRVRRVAIRIKIALGRPPKAIVGVGAATLGMATVCGRATIRPAPLPEDPAKAIAELDRWLRRYMDVVDAAVERLDDELAVERKSREDLHGAVDKLHMELDAQDRDIAAGGARMAAVGLLVVLLGTVLQGIALLID